MAKGKKQKWNRKKKKLSHARVARIWQNINDAELELVRYSHHVDEFSSKTVGTPSQIIYAKERLERYKKKLCV